MYAPEQSISNEEIAAGLGLEAETGISVPDSDVKPANFQTLEAIERYVESRKG